MYRIYINQDETKCIYYTGDPVYILDNIEIELTLGEAGSLKFDMFKGHPFYNDILPRETLITVMKGSGYTERVFDGEVREVEKDLDGIMEVYCVGELSYLYDTIQKQAEFHGTPEDYLQLLLDEHNSQETQNNKKFLVGTLDIADDYIYRFVNYRPTIDELRADLCETFKVYPKTRRVNAGLDADVYLDLYTIENYGVDNTQRIEFGLNIMDYNESETVDDLYTAVLPLGRKKMDFERDQYDNPALDAYYTVREVNGGTLYLTNPTALNQYGYVCALEEWENIDIPETLRRTAEAWLQTAQYKTLSLTLKALDLSVLGSEYEAFHLGDMVRCLATPLDIDITLPVIEMKIYPLNPENNVLTIGAETPSLTRQTAQVEDDRSEGEDTSITDWATDHSFSTLQYWVNKTDDVGPNWFGNGSRGVFIEYPLNVSNFKKSGPASEDIYGLNVGPLPNFTDRMRYDTSEISGWDDGVHFGSKWTDYDGTEKPFVEIDKINAVTNFPLYTTFGLSIPMLFEDFDLSIKGTITGTSGIVKFDLLSARQQTKVLPWHTYNYYNGTFTDGSAALSVIDSIQWLGMVGDIIVRATLPWRDLDDKPSKLYAQFTIAIVPGTEKVLVDQNDNYLVDENGNTLGQEAYTVPDGVPMLDITWGNYTRTLNSEELSIYSQTIVIELTEGELKNVLGPTELHTYLQHIILRSRSQYPLQITNFHLWGDTDIYEDNTWRDLWAM